MAHTTKRATRAREPVYSKQPHEYVSANEHYAYLGHFAQDRFLSQGHNAGYTSQYNDAYPQVEAPATILGMPAIQPAPVPSTNYRASNIVFPIRTTGQAPVSNIEYPKLKEDSLVKNQSLSDIVERDRAAEDQGNSAQNTLTEQTLRSGYTSLGPGFGAPYSAPIPVTLADGSYNPAAFDAAGNQIHGEGMGHIPGIVSSVAGSVVSSFIPVPGLGFVIGKGIKHYANKFNKDQAELKHENQEGFNAQNTVDAFRANQTVNEYRELFGDQALPSNNSDFSSGEGDVDVSFHFPDGSVMNPDGSITQGGSSVGDFGGGEGDGLAGGDFGGIGGGGGDRNEDRGGGSGSSGGPVGGGPTYGGGFNAGGGEHGGGWGGYSGGGGGGGF